jgi:hypothetical protein
MMYCPAKNDPIAANEYQLDNNCFTSYQRTFVRRV